MNRLAGLIRTAALGLAVLTCAASVAAQQPAAPLFADDAALEMELRFDFSKICAPTKKINCEALPGSILYTDNTETLHQIDVALRTRGRWQRRMGKCELPALFIDFQSDKTVGTVFQGQTTLPLTAHCHHTKKSYHRYALSEYLAYRLYNLVTDDSLRVRLALITYTDAGSHRVYQRFGFFSEHFKDLAKRTGTEYYDAEQLKLKYTDATQTATLAVFQYLIGNLDWSIIGIHNIAPFQREDGTIVPVPFDFDYSGLVDAKYATAPDFFNIRSVRTRKYRGFCRTDIDWDAVFSRFVDIRAEVMTLAGNQAGLRPGDRRKNVRYLEKFYNIIESEAKRREEIVEACRRIK